MEYYKISKIPSLQDYVFDQRFQKFRRLTIRNHPFSTAGGPIAFVLREQVSQIFHSGGA